MHLNLLHLDDALTAQPRFIEACAALRARQTDLRREGTRVRRWGKNHSMELLRQAISASGFRPLNRDTTVTFMGSGDFQHVSVMLLKMLLQLHNHPVTVIHFDNRPDWVRFHGGMHCSAWINKAITLPQVDKVITIGSCSRALVNTNYGRANLRALRRDKVRLLPWQSPGRRFRTNEIGGISEDIFCQLLRTQVKTRNLYITIDKSVLSMKDAVTNSDQGQMPLPYLLATLRFLMSRYHVIGVDVAGDYSPVRFGGHPHHVILKKLESLMEQPQQRHEHQLAAAVNEASNLAILNCLREAA